MNHRKSLFVAVAATAALVAAGCSSSGGGSGGGGNATGSGGSGGGGAKTLTVGVITDVTGPAASGNKTSPDGVKAGVALAKRQGVTIKYVVGDTATNPTTALAAATKLVTQNHVDAVILHSALGFAAAPYLTAHHIPVVGIAEDGPEWITAKNMFSVTGALHTTKVATTMGTFFKNQGVTNLATIGYSISPSSAETAKAAAKSAETAGLKAGYVNSKFPFGSTDVGPVVLAMKKAKVDGLVTSLDPNTSFAIISAARQQGVNLKVALLPTGYGGDTTQAGAGALAAAQNVYFLLAYEPVEMKTAATKQFQADLASAGVTGEPTFAMYNGYVSIGLLTQAVKAANSTKSTALTTALSNIHDFTAMGLYGTHKLDINNRTGLVNGVDNCSWIAKLEGNTFQPVAGAIPVCGTEIKGATVSAD